jgi:uncharacterized membrane protein YGL010W
MTYWLLLWVLGVICAWFVVGWIMAFIGLFLAWYEGQDIHVGNIRDALHLGSMFGVLYPLIILWLYISEKIENACKHNPRVCRGRKSAALARELRKPL